MGNERIPENFAENSSNWPISAVFLQNLQIIKLQIFRFSASTPLSSDYLFYNSLKIIVLGGGGIDWFIESRSLNGMGLTSRWGDVSCFHQDFVRRIFHVL